MSIPLKSAALVLGLAGAFATPFAAGAHDPSEAEQVLLDQPLGAIAGKHGVITLIEAPGGYQTPWHTHPGDVFIYVIEGAVEIEYDDGEKQVIHAGEAAHETPNRPMVGRNLSADEGARLVVFQVGDQGAPMMVAHPKQ